jgi:hypothetical protein
MFGLRKRTPFRQYVRMLETEGAESSLNGALRIRMLIDIRRALGEGMDFSDIGVKDACALEAIITRVESRTFRDIERDKSILVKVRMTEDDVLMFFRGFLHELITEDGRRHALEIRRTRPSSAVSD